MLARNLLRVLPPASLNSSKHTLKHALSTPHALPCTLRIIPSRLFTSTPSLKNQHLPEPLLSKYASKLQKKAEADGFKSVEEYLAAQKKKEEEEKVRRWKEEERKALEEKERREKEAEKKAGSGEGKAAAGDGGKKVGGKAQLSDILNLDLARLESSSTISEIWNTHHTQTPHTLSGVLPPAFYKSFLERSSKYPYFILPLPKENGGVEFYWMQVTRDGGVYFTSLEEYKLKQEKARPYLILTHFTDLLAEKDIVLMRGEIQTFAEGSGGLMLKADEARLLVLLMQAFYVTGSEEKKRLLVKLHEKPGEFDFNDLLRAVDTLD
ncbi:hypothetical protein HDV05_001616 [Chytridiales sp. JEL 0842]|nr:hypothetical protein HDV05_001616 [Chytridiales sp. JEL 0842]